MVEKDSMLQVRMAADEKASFETAAAAAGVSVSSWVRERLRTAAMRELQAAGVKVPFLETLKGSL